MKYKVNYQNHIKNEIVLTDLRQDWVKNIFSNLKDAKRLLIHYLKKDIAKGDFSFEEKNQIKKRITEINKMTMKSFNTET